MIWRLGDCLEKTEEEEWRALPAPSVFLTDSRNARKVLDMAGIQYENDIQLGQIGFCKLETQQECLVGTLCIPKLLDVLGSRYRIYFFINQDHVVLVDDEDFSMRLIRRIKRRKAHQGETKERFIYNYIAEFMSRDQELLLQYEKTLMHMEEDAMQGKIEKFQQELMPIRRKLSEPAQLLR